MTDAEKGAIKDMVRSNPGWQVLAKWCAMEIEGGKNILVEKDDDLVRGKIKAYQLLIDKFNRIAYGNKKEKQPKTKRRYNKNPARMELQKKTNNAPQLQKTLPRNRGLPARRLLQAHKKPGQLRDKKEPDENKTNTWSKERRKKEKEKLKIKSFFI